ncbi:MAG: hypothetical protein IJC63_01035, partial [Myxococcaceae bacterium]|nr:hypothetical protein [Myxococcaceae bacterium]
MRVHADPWRPVQGAPPKNFFNKINNLRRFYSLFDEKSERRLDALIAMVSLRRAFDGMICFVPSKTFFTPTPFHFK